MIFLYIKRHSITGLKYFGRTVRNPFKYFGSGQYWQPHIKKHGKQFVETLEVWGFDDQELCTEFALKFSRENNIVESNEWANEVEENGCHIPNMKNFKMKEESKLKISKGCKNQLWWNNGTIQIRSEVSPGPDFFRGRLPFSRKSHSEETKRKISNSHKGKVPGNKGKPMSEEQRAKLSRKSMGLVQCIDITTGTRHRVPKEIFDINPDLVGSTSKIGLKSIQNHSMDKAAL